MLSLVKQFSEGVITLRRKLVKLAGVNGEEISSSFGKDSFKPLWKEMV